MRAFSGTMLAFILGVSSFAIAATPAFAQDKLEKPAKAEKPKKEKKPKKDKEADANAKPTVSTEFGKAIAPYDAAAKANNWPAAKAAVAAAAALAKPPMKSSSLANI
jgi:hypothetical protein